jgi:hypothetical protein
LRTYAFRKQVLTGFEGHNLLLAPFCPEKFARMEIRQGWVNQRSRNLPAPVANFVARTARLEAAFLAIPVSGRKFPAIRLQQTAVANGLALRIELGEEVIGLVIPNSSANVRIETAKSNELTPEVTRV